MKQIKFIVAVFIFAFSTNFAFAESIPKIEQLPPNKAVVVNLIDNESAMVKHSYIYYSASNSQMLNQEEMVLYGNNIKDPNGANKFDRLTIQVPDTNKVAAVGYVVEPKVGSSIVKLSILKNEPVLAGTASNMYSCNQSYSLSNEQSVLNSMKNCVLSGNKVVSNTLPIPLIDDVTLGLNIGTNISPMYLGDPDVMSDYVRNIWVFVLYNDSTYKVWKIDPNLGSKRLNFVPADISEANAILRGKYGRVDIVPKETEGVLYWDVKIMSRDFATVYADFQASNPFFRFELPSPINSQLVLQVQAVGPSGGKSNPYYKLIDSFVRIDIDSKLADIEFSEYKIYIEYLYKLGIVDGYSDGMYRPYEGVTRAQLAKYMVNVFELPIDGSGVWFPDVNINSNLGIYIQTLKNAGIISGYSDGLFRPDSLVTRAESTKFLYNSANFGIEYSLIDANCYYPDYGNFGVFYKYICALTSNVSSDYDSIVDARSNGLFEPNVVLTRGEMSKMVLNAGMHIKGKNNGNPFINIPDPNEVGLGKGLLRPGQVKNFRFDAVASNKVGLRWDDLESVDGTIDGYLLQRSIYTNGGWSVWTVVNVGNIQNGFIGDSADTKIDDIIPTLVNDTSVGSKQTYKYRLASVKWIPYTFSETSYVSQEDMEKDKLNTNNMLIGKWSNEIQVTTN